VTRAQRWLVHGANLAVGGTGLVYAWMAYLAKPADEWAVVHHPWQPQVQHLHVLTAPLLIFAIGLIWASHVGRRWTAEGCENRHSGTMLALLFPAMAASGYLLQVSVDDHWRLAWTVVHVGASLVWIAGFAAHWLIGWRRGRTAEGDAPRHPSGWARD